MLENTVSQQLIEGLATLKSRPQWCVYSEDIPGLTHPRIVYGEGVHSNRFAVSDLSSQSRADEEQRHGMARKKCKSSKLRYQHSRIFSTYGTTLEPASYIEA